MNEIYWRAFIGPRFHGKNFSHNFDWQGFGVSPSVRVLANGWVPGNATIECDTSVNFPAFALKGGLWVYSPSGPGVKGIAYVEYTSALGNNFLNVIHYASDNTGSTFFFEVGDEVRQWYPLDFNNGILSLSMQGDSDLISSDFSMQVQGITAPKDLLLLGHIIAIQTRTSLADPWTTFAKGWITNTVVQQDSAIDNTEWSVQCRGINHFLAMEEADPLVVGKVNIALGSSVESSSTIGNPLFEVDTGDVVGWDPPVEAESTVDGNKESLWISEQMVGGPFPYRSDYYNWVEFYLNPIVGQSTKSNYLVMHAPKLQGRALYYWNHGDTTWTLVNDMPGGVEKDWADNTFVVFASNSNAFSEQHPGYRGSVFVPRVGNVPLLDILNPAGGWLGWRYSGPGGDTQANILLWGDVSDRPGITDLPDWTGPSIPAPTSGQIWYRHTTAGTGQENEANFWMSDRKGAGDIILADGDDVWILWRLPGMELELAEDVNIGDTSLPIRSIDGYGTTDGLDDAGTLAVGREEVPYSAKLADSVTCSPLTQAHIEGDPILIRDSRGLYTDAYSVDTFGFWRYGKSPYATAVQLGFSSLDGPTPADTEHEQFYTRNGYWNPNWTPSAPDFGFTPTGFPLPDRIKTVVLGFKFMSTNPGRARLNEFEATLDRSKFGTNQWIASSQPDVVANKLIENALGYDNLISVEGIAPAPYDNGATASDNLWSVCRDLAAMTSSLLAANMTGGIAWRNSILGAGTPWPTNTHTWDETDIISFQLNAQQQTIYSQVEMSWHKPNETEINVSVYPVIAGNRGKVLEIGEQIFPDEATANAYASKQYYLNQYPFTFTAELLGIRENLEIGDAVQLSPSFVTHNVHRRGIITGITHDIREQVGSTTIQAKEIGRTIA